MNKNIYDCFYKKLYKVRNISNFMDIVYDGAKLFPQKSAFEIKENGKVRNISYSNLKEDFQYLGTALLNLGLKDKKIAIVGKNSYWWALSYLCASSVGVAVPIDKELSAEDICNFLTDGDCDAIIGDYEFLKNIKEIYLKNILYISTNENVYDDKENSSFFNNNGTSISRLINAGKQAYESGDKYIDMLQIDENKMSVLLFTSGTTGKSKGVCLSHKNICSNIKSTSRMVKIHSIDKTLSILPLHHTYECTLGFLMVLYCGGCISFCDGLSKIPQNLTQYSPSVLLAVPELLKHMHKKIVKEIINKCPEKYKEYFRVMPISEALKKTPLFLSFIIKRKVRKSLGGKLRLFIVGAAGIESVYIEDFLTLGIRTLQGYGLTECSPLLAGNNDFYLNPKSTGIPIPEVEVKIENPNAEGIGEIIAKGDNIMLGYYNDEEATAQAFSGGYFHTGDLGCFDERGFLYIQGRIKNVIVTSNGKNIYPEELETRLYEYNEVGETLVLAALNSKGETCVKAKIFPNIDFIRGKIGITPTLEDMHSAIAGIIESLNKRIPSYKRIAMFEIILNEFEKTTTKKIKRYGANTI